MRISQMYVDSWIYRGIMSDIYQAASDGLWLSVRENLDESSVYDPCNAVTACSLVATGSKTVS